MLMGKKLLEHFTKKNGKKQIKKFRTKKQEKADKLYVKWKRYNDSFDSWINEKDIVQISEHFPKPKSVAANLSNYATKTDLKNAARDDTSSFA